MAGQPEVATYDALVYQWEVTDAVQGGRGNIANTPLLNLANRTGYLLAGLNTVIASDALKAPKASPVLTGGAALTGPAGTALAFDFQTSLVNRWAVETDGATESGGNVGSNFAVARYNDAGAFIDFPLFINRATGVITSSQTTALNTSGNAATSGKWLNARSLAMTGDVTYNVSIDGSGNVTGAGTIAAGAVTPAKMQNALANSIFANLTGAPAAPTWATFAAFALALGFTGNIGANSGHIVLPVNIGGVVVPIYIQWGQVASTISTERQISVTFDTPFPTACLKAIGDILNTSNSALEDIWLQSTNSNTTTTGVFFCQGTSSTPGTAQGVDYIAFGY